MIEKGRLLLRYHIDLSLRYTNARRAHASFPRSMAWTATGCTVASLQKLTTTLKLIASPPLPPERRTSAPSVARHMPPWQDWRTIGSPTAATKSSVPNASDASKHTRGCNGIRTYRVKGQRWMQSTCVQTATAFALISKQCRPTRRLAIWKQEWRARRVKRRRRRRRKKMATMTMMAMRKSRKSNESRRRKRTPQRRGTRPALCRCSRFSWKRRQQKRRRKRKRTKLLLKKCMLASTLAR